MQNKKLTRSTNKVIAGVCGGLAEYFDLDPTLIRVAYVVATAVMACFPGILVYIIMMLIMPQAPTDNFGGNQASGIDVSNK